MTNSSHVDDNTIRDYRRSVERLVDDIEDAITDLTFLDNQGEIKYAVDFTEIYSFVYPTNETPEDNRSKKHRDTHATSWFPGLSDSEAAALNIAVLRSLFFGTVGSKYAPPVVLLSPYRVEFRRSEAVFQRSSISNLKRLVDEAVAELGNLRVDKDLMNLLDRHEQAEQAGEPLTQHEDHLLFHLKNNASKLLQLMISQQSWSPQARVKELLRDANLLDLSSSKILGRSVSQPELDQNLVFFLHHEISRIRLERVNGYAGHTNKERDLKINAITATSHLDALAVAYIVRANDILASQSDAGKQKLVLISRSASVFEAIRRYTLKYQNHRIANFFRGPSAYGIMLMQPGTSFRERREGLRQRRLSLELALRALSPNRLRKEVTADLNEDRTRALARIEDLTMLWKDSVTMTIAYGDLNSAKPDSSFASIRALLRDERYLNSLISQLASHLATDISFTNAMLAQLRLREEDNTGIGISEDLATSSTAQSLRRTFLWSTKTARTLGLYFYNELVRETKHSGGSAERALERLLNVSRPIRMDDGNDDESLGSTSYQSALMEACLASSFLAAISDQWNIAEIYSNLALSWSADLDPTPRHEAYYMRAVSRHRGRNPGIKILKAGLNDLMRAEEDLRKVERDPKTLDPRFVYERGVHLFSWWEHIDEKAHRAGDDRIERPDELDDETEIDLTSVPESPQLRLDAAINQFDTAYGIVHADIENYSRRGNVDQVPPSLARQLVDVANARCYVRVRIGQVDDRAVRFLFDLHRAVALCGWTHDNMPISVLDTIAWATFQLRTSLPSEHMRSLKAITNILVSRLPQITLPEIYRKTIDYHISEITTVINEGLLRDATPSK